MRSLLHTDTFLQKTFPVYVKLMTHNLATPVTTRTIYMCSDCDFFSGFLHVLKTHKRRCIEKKSNNETEKQDMKTMHICTDCELSTTDESEIKSHDKKACMEYKEKLRDKKDKPVMRMMYVCPECNYMTADESEKELHDRRACFEHAALKISTSCQTEDTNLTSSPLVVIARPCTSKDIKTEEGRGKVCVSCQTDELEFPEKKKNERTDCPHCSYTTTNKHSMKAHLRIHTGEKPFACTYCDKKFALKSNLSIHTRIHTGQRPYTCESCGQAFASKGVLVRHQIRWHTEERPFVCEICFMGFKFKPDLKHHKKTHNYG